MRVATLVKSIAARICLFGNCKENQTVWAPAFSEARPLGSFLVSYDDIVIARSAIRGGGRLIEIDGQNARLAVGAHSYNFL